MALIAIVALWATCAGRAQEAEPAPIAELPDAAGPPPIAVAAGAHDPWSSPEIAAPHMSTDVIKRPRAGRGDRAGAEPQKRGHPWVRTSASLAGVVVLIILLAWGYRLGTRASTRFALNRRGRQTDLIQVISRTNLAPRQSLCLVRIGPQLVLIGATHDSLRALSVVDDPDLAARLAGQEAQQQPDSHLAEFRHCLDTAARGYDNVDQPDDTGAPEVAPVIDIQQKLSQTVRRLQTVAGRA